MEIYVWRLAKGFEPISFEILISVINKSAKTFAKLAAKLSCEFLQFCSILMIPSTVFVAFFLKLYASFLPRSCEFGRETLTSVQLWIWCVCLSETSKHWAELAVGRWFLVYNLLDESYVLVLRRSKNWQNWLTFIKVYVNLSLQFGCYPMLWGRLACLTSRTLCIMFQSNQEFWFVLQYSSIS